ncbi:hypothetical protein EYF80_055731 [Liparis tanakae]|uniref:Uncharacterized protein n=1 Tax=Liparis tanakae TaxID=230148 RepID=A0A4Z2F008_9TELE|nr:hypothetical protein EYF80_055731 [Liparis tanakae]
MDGDGWSRVEVGGAGRVEWVEVGGAGWSGWSGWRWVEVGGDGWRWVEPGGASSEWRASPRLPLTTPAVRGRSYGTPRTNPKVRLTKTIITIGKPVGKYPEHRFHRPPSSCFSEDEAGDEVGDGAGSRRGGGRDEDRPPPETRSACHGWLLALGSRLRAQCLLSLKLRLEALVQQHQTLDGQISAICIGVFFGHICGHQQHKQ